MALLTVKKFRSYLSDQFQNFANRLSSVFSRKDQTGYSLEMTMDPKTFILTIKLKDVYGNVLNTQEENLPIDSFLVGGEYDEETKMLKIKLGTGTVLEISVADMVSGLMKDNVTIAGLSIKNSPDAAALRTALGLKSVATSGSYTDLTNKPKVILNQSEAQMLTGNTLYLNGTSSAATSDNKANIAKAWLQVGGGGRIGTDSEGGFLQLHPPSGIDRSGPYDFYHLDVFDHNIRLYASPKDISAGYYEYFHTYGNDAKGGNYWTIAPINFGNVSTKIVPKANNAGATITQSGGKINGTIVTDITKTSDTVTAITETCSKNDVTVWTKTTTVTEGTDGSYTVLDNGVEVGAWTQAVFIMNELKKKLGVS